MRKKRLLSFSSHPPALDWRAETAGCRFSRFNGAARMHGRVAEGSKSGTAPERSRSPLWRTSCTHWVTPSHRSGAGDGLGCRVGASAIDSLPEPCRRNCGIRPSTGSPCRHPDRTRHRHPCRSIARSPATAWKTTPDIDLGNSPAAGSHGSKNAEIAAALAEPSAAGFRRCFPASETSPVEVPGRRSWPFKCEATNQFARTLWNRPIFRMPARTVWITMPPDPVLRKLRFNPMPPGSNRSAVS